MTGPNLPITLMLAVEAEESPLLLVAVQVYRPSSLLTTELITRDPLEKRVNLSPEESSLSAKINLSK